jgi:hypothetical protein
MQNYLIFFVYLNLLKTLTTKGKNTGAPHNLSIYRGHTKNIRNSFASSSIYIEVTTKGAVL